ncbi:LuxR C-terminal-related transcriptional regulator [Streptomyces sp. NPDC057199]|uniref:LuxR C-terminal-related transcriptional regulator n=1 Tax=Streptomyces sp. NPDC057199 TaxID=3346047 RepID=UPI00363918AB
MRKVLELAGTPVAGAGDPESAEVSLTVAAGELGERLATGTADPAQVGALLAKVYALRHELSELREDEQAQRRAALDASLVRLGAATDSDELLDRACEAVVEGCGFGRVMLSRVDGSLWRPWKSYAVGDREADRPFREWITAIPEIRLDNMLLETEMVRTRQPALVTDPVHDPRVYRPLLRASALTSYVAAPLLPTGRVIGFLHADHLDAPVTALDRDLLWAFALGFGRLFERAVLLTRLREQREQVRVAMRTVEAVLDDLASAEIELTRHAAVAELRPARTRPRSSAALERLLTAREHEVLALMATGATNNRIADELVITSGTVKSHVKHILRKLGAENRAEAISQYFRLTMADPS